VFVAWMLGRCPLFAPGLLVRSGGTACSAKPQF